MTTMVNFLNIEMGKKSNHGISNMLVAGWLNIFIAEPILLIPGSALSYPIFRSALIAKLIKLAEAEA